MTLDDELHAARERREARGLERHLETSDAGAESRRLIDFASNDYLGLARDPALVDAAHAAVSRHGTGGRAARLLGGGSLEREVETRAAAWLGTEAALFFPTGYQANLGLVTALTTRGDLILSDEFNHASLIDAARLSRARVEVYAHANPVALEKRLAHPSARTARRRIVTTESVFSMDGDLAPLAALLDVCERHDAWLLVDEAHAVGLLGPRRQGATAGLDSERLAARVVTGGKALGTGGAVVAASAAIIDELVNCARSFVFTTAPVPAAVAAFGAAIDLVESSSERSQRALALARHFATELGLDEPAAAIVPVILGSASAALEAATTLRAQGFDVRAVRPPTVPVGTSRLRVSIHAEHDLDTIDRLAAGVRPFLETRNTSPGRSGPRGTNREVRARTPLVVAGTDTDIGKTVVAALLLRAARRRGPATYWKPVQTGDDSDTRTVAALNELSPDALPAPAFEFPLPASPHEAAAAAGSSIDPDAVSAALHERVRARPDGETVVLELAGGILVPWTDDVTQLDWLTELPCELVLVARSGLGTLNHTLLTLEALRARSLEPRALFLVGPHHPSNRRTLERLGCVRALFEVPRFAQLDTAALDEWIDAHPLDAVFEPAPQRT